VSIKEGEYFEGSDIAFPRNTLLHGISLYKLLEGTLQLI
jgi:hypothetical protein